MIVPAIPMTSPSIMKTRIMPPDVVPMDLSIAISFPFSMTTIMSVLMMLRLATITINTSIMNIATFSSLRAEKRFLFMSIHVLT